LNCAANPSGVPVWLACWFGEMLPRSDANQRLTD
jgi:hypothetical protein